MAIDRWRVIMRIDILRNVNKKDGKMVKIVFFVKYRTWNYVHLCVKISHKRIRVCKTQSQTNTHI